MSHYSDDPKSVRVDFFKQSGKWYTTEAVPWTGKWTGKGSLILDEFAVSIARHLSRSSGTYRLEGMIAVCLDPYHEHSHPIMMPVDEAIRIAKQKETMSYAKAES